MNLILLEILDGAMTGCLFWMMHPKVFLYRGLFYQAINKTCEVFIMKPAINVSLVPELRHTPHIHTRKLDEVCRTAFAMGYRGIEFFPGRVSEVSVSQISEIAERNSLEVCAFGTGAGKSLFGLTLSDPDSDVRKEAVDYIRQIMEIAENFGAMVIIGSMQGSAPDGIPVAQALNWLEESLSELKTIAGGHHVTLVLEPLNRYESNLINTLDQGVDLLERIGNSNLGLLADLFHMNIEERSVEEAIIRTGNQISHVHFADSNRLFPGLGHTDFNPVFGALKQIRFEGFLSVEALVSDAKSDLQHAMKIFNTFVH
jgi:sugar phosphate isomerase/epimerase